jgi:hypothetical protein
MLQTVINSDEDAVKTVNEILRYSSIWLSIREYIYRNILEGNTGRSELYFFDIN